MAEAGLILFWCLFFREFLQHPFRFATSEFISTWFPTWICLGKRRPNTYFGTTWGFPPIAAWYPPNLLSTLVGSIVNLDTAFIFYGYFVFGHYLVASWFAYQLFGNLFMAVTLTYMMRVINLNPSGVFTWTWFIFSLWMLQAGHAVAAGIGLALMFSGGYPILCFYLSPFVFLWGVPVQALAVATFISLPQFIVTLRHLTASIRGGATYASKSMGSVPPWHWVSLLWPLRWSLNGVLYPELSYGIGRIAAGCVLWGLAGYLRHFGIEVYSFAKH